MEIIYTHMCIVWNESARTGLHKSDAMRLETCNLAYFVSVFFRPFILTNLLEPE